MYTHMHTCIDLAAARKAGVSRSKGRDSSAKGSSAKPKVRRPESRPASK